MGLETEVALGRFLGPLELDLVPLRPKPKRRTWRQWFCSWLCFWRQRRRRWRLRGPFIYTTSDGSRYEAPANTIVDGASIPTFCYRVIGPPWGDYAEASVIHDYLWGLARTGLISFARANWVFLDGMRALDVPKWRRWSMWLAVTAKSWTMRRGLV